MLFYLYFVAEKWVGGEIDSGQSTGRMTVVMEEKADRWATIRGCYTLLF